MSKQSEHTISIQRLTALWALTESGLGGIMHAFKSPFTGLILGSIAMVLITLICHHTEKPWATILKSLSIVLIVKMMVSPHALISAYFAVSFQAIVGAFLYQLIGINLLSILLLTCLGMVESALQKIVSLTVLYGSSIWDAVNELGNWISRKLSYLLPFETTEMLIGTYVTLYFVWGIFLGFFTYRLVKLISNQKDLSKFMISIQDEKIDVKKKSKRSKLLRIIFMIILLACFIVSILLVSENQFFGWKQAAYVFLRTIGILVIWYFLLAPVLLKWLKKKLANKQSELSTEVDQIFSLIPFMKNIIFLAWNESSNKKGLSRITEFCYSSLLYCLHAQIPKA